MSDERNGNFLDENWCCKVCDGEIPDGHTNDCDIWKMEKRHRDFITNEYNSVLIERDSLRNKVAELERERDAANHARWISDVRANEASTACDSLRERVKALEEELSGCAKPLDVLPPDHPDHCLCDKCVTLENMDERIAKSAALGERNV